MAEDKGKKYKILILEDEKMLMHLLSSKLEKEGFEVYMAFDGKEGWQKIKEGKADLILLDIIMPKMNGYEVLENMRAAKINIPVIIISNSGQPVEIEKTKELGAVDYLIKTEFEPIEVLEKVKNYLGKNGIAQSKISEELPKPRQAEGVRKLDLNVLLVEDDPFLREICSKKLAKEGYSVYEAADGAEALDAVKKIKPHIVLLDVILPTMDGFQILKSIRADKDKEIAQVPIIMLSNLGQEDDIKRAMDSGANDYLVKAHFTTDEIADRINLIFKK